jgi:hypothetical protein
MNNFMNGFVAELTKHAAVDTSQGTSFVRGGNRAPSGAGPKPKPGVDAPMNPYPAKPKTTKTRFASMSPEAIAKDFTAAKKARKGKGSKPAGEKTTKWQRHLRKAKTEGGSAGLATARKGKSAFLAKDENKGAQRYSKPGAPADRPGTVAAKRGKPARKPGKPASAPAPVASARAGFGTRPNLGVGPLKMPTRPGASPTPSAAAPKRRRVAKPAPAAAPTAAAPTPPSSSPDAFSSQLADQPAPAPAPKPSHKRGFTGTAPKPMVPTATPDLLARR